MPLQAMAQYLRPFADARDGCSNLSLRADKLNPEVDVPNPGQSQAEHDKKKAALAFRASFRFHGPGRTAYDVAFHRREKLFGTVVDDAELIEIEAQTAVILGSGNPNIHEAGLHLLRPWGVPYISGSTIKGVLSSYLSLNGGDEWRRSLPQKSKLQVQLFGGMHDDDAYIGSVQFCDAWIKPHPGPWFQNDIITPHHKAYNGGAEGVFPNGMEDPVPIGISVLKSGLVFQLVIIGPETERQFVKSALGYALDQMGLGAKTAVGYGRFTILESTSDIKAKISECSIEELEKILVEHGEKEDLRRAYRERLRTLDCVEEGYPKVANLFKKLFPARVILAEMQAKKPKTLKEAKQIRDDVDKKMTGSHVDPSDPDIQAIFNFCLPLAKDQKEVENGWLKAFAYGWEHVEINDDNALEILEGLEDRPWPPKHGFLEALKNVSFKDGETKELILMEAEERYKS